MNEVTLVAVTLMVGKWLAQLALEQLNQANVAAHAEHVPPAFKDMIDPAAYAKSTEYTLAKSRLSQMEDTYDTAILLLVLLSGVLPWVFEWFTRNLGQSAWAMAAFLFATGVGLSIVSLPFDWHGQFHLEEHFGFNTMTPKTWWLDRLKGLLLTALLGYPLLALILKLVDWTGSAWWLWAWACVIGFQLLMLVLAPILILPLFNKFSPLPQGSLRDRLLALGERTGFRAQSIQVMDGSKRSRHSNAFFTGFGRFRCLCVCSAT
jgi:STE24 endopeptidase